MCIDVHVHIYTYTYMHIYVYTYIHTYMYIYIYIHTCTHKHTYMYIHIRICIYKCIYTRMHRLLMQSSSSSRQLPHTGFVKAWRLGLLDACSALQFWAGAARVPPHRSFCRCLAAAWRHAGTPCTPHGLLQSALTTVALATSLHLFSGGVDPRFDFLWQGDLTLDRSSTDLRCCGLCV